MSGKIFLITGTAGNLAGTGNILALCLKHRIKKLIYISSTSVIPELPGSQPIVNVLTL